MAGTSFSAIDISKFPPKLNILVIDTDPEALELIEKTCKENSHQVVKCFESSRAVDVLLKKEIDIHLILMELHMPMNGFAFLHFLNEEEFDIPFVMMSKDITWFFMTKAFQLGAIEYFMKPFDGRLDLLSPFLRHYCARRNLKDDETSDEEAKTDDTLYKKDDTLYKTDDTLSSRRERISSRREMISSTREMISSTGTFDKKDGTLDKKDGTLV